MKLETVLLVGLAGLALYWVMKPQQAVVVTVPTQPAPQQVTPSQSVANNDVFNQVLAGIKAAAELAKQTVDTVTSTVKNA